jgi:hypothetical protein
MKTGYIYTIVCLDTNVKDCYVGSCSVMAKRRCAHKTACNNSNSKDHNLNVYQFIRANGGWSNWSMIALEQVEYTIKHELLVRERYHLEKLKATLNKVIPTRTPREYYEENKTEIGERIKEYRETNKTEISQYQKEYRQENKTEIAQYQKEYRQENKTEIAQYQKKYRQENKTQLLEKMKALITCDCHRTFRKADIAQHKKSKTHKQFEHYYNFIHS